MTGQAHQLEQERLAELEQAFELFNQTSLQLTEAYESLQHQVEDLQSKLDKSNLEKYRVGEHLEQLLNLLPAGVIVLNEQNQVVDMNPAAEVILGAKLMKQTWETVLKEVFLTRNDAGELIAQDQKIYQLSESPLNLSNQEKPVLGRILLIQDVTDARVLQQHINRHQRLNSMGEMAASLAHQIRTPLASALLYVSQMSSATLNEDRREKFVGKALSSLRHLESLVKDMLQYAKGGKAKDQKVSVNDLFDALKHAIEPKVQLTSSQVSFYNENREDVILGDQDALMTALQNLVDNAIDIIVTEPKIQVSSRALKEKPFIDLMVTDNGPGLTDEMKEKVFEPFYTSRAQGTGLGLAVVRAVAEAHGGEVWVESIEGKGATFGLRIPLLVNEERS